MNSPRLAAIYRFPVKGFHGQPLAHAAVHADRGGIPFDRFLGISNGEGTISSTDWSPCQHFVRMTKNDGLPRFDVELDETDQTVRMTSPSGETLSVEHNNDDSMARASTTLSSWFPAKHASPPRMYRRRNALGWWDHHDATVSIINNASVASLSHAYEGAIDAMRFRGNLYLDGLTAWEEFAWTGKRIWIGDVELEILRPIDRCSATSVNPTSAIKDVNIPALLAKSFGHVFCGVYARVVSGGVLRLNDQVRVGDVTTRSSSPPYVIVDTAPPVSQWPRRAAVVSCVRESANTTSFWLQDPLAKWRWPVKPGQRLRVHAPESGLAAPWRSYTVSGTLDDRLRISVKREASPNAFSNWLHEKSQVGSELVISGPYGNFTLDSTADAPRAIALISAGIGITPMLAMLRSLSANEKPSRDIYVLHSARSANHLALWEEMREAARNVSAKTCHLYLSSPEPGDLQIVNASHGRIDAKALEALPFSDVQIYACGPADFMSAIRTIALSRGTLQDAFHTEKFISPSTEAHPSRAIERAGPFNVVFAKSKQSSEWIASQGTLLDLSEQCHIRISSNCRAGACGACKVSLRQGQVMHLVEPSLPLAEDEILTCCAVPTTNITIDA
jgi:ferredoxin-NADP reductase/uncharacterized protein YcbX